MRSLTLCYLAVSAGVTEEIFFRGLPALYLSAILSPTKVNILYPLLSALAFGFIHWENGSSHVVITFLLGFLLAMLYLNIGNLWPFIVGHATTDILAFAGYF